jgi:N-acetylglucosaminyldiphosphoundecaprenol N-acetyl-beta-D-mannosaminyltransferase
MDDAAILDRIEAAKPQILLVAFGNPKQEYWIHRNHDELRRLGVRVAVGIGGALEMIAGSLKRAPRWIQRLQMEWLFRMAQEPARLLPRYAGDACALLRHLPVLLAVSRMQPQKDPSGKLITWQNGRIRVIATPATLTGTHCGELVVEAKIAAESSRMMVIDMSATTRIEADGLGCLLQARRVILAGGAELRLAGVSRPVRRVLQFSAISDLFGRAVVTADGVHFEPELDRSLVFASEKIMQHYQHRSAVETVEV